MSIGLALGVQLGGNDAGAPRFTIRDDFTDTLAAGSVDGTDATPGPGVRDVADTEEIAAVSGGKLNFSGITNPSWSDYTIQYAAIDRSAGVVATVAMTYTSGTYYCFGFDLANTTPNGNIFMRYGAVNMKVRQSPGADVVIGSTSDFAGDFSLAVVLREIGAMYFYNLGSGWVLAFIGDVGDRASNLVKFRPYNCDIALDAIRIPTELWLPTPKLSDGFGTAGNISDGLGHAEGVAGGIGSGGDSVTWIGSTWINSGGVRSNSITEADYQANTDSTLFDPAELDTPHILADASWIIQSGTQAGLVACLDDAATPANFLIVFHDGTNIAVEKCVSGTYTTIATVAATYSADAPITARTLPDGDDMSLWVWYNGAYIGNWSIADAGIVENTLHGVFSTHEDNECSSVAIYNTVNHSIPGA